MKFRGFSLDPFNKFLYILVFEHTVYCMVVIEQPSFRKIGMNLSMTNSVKQNDVFAFIFGMRWCLLGFSGRGRLQRGQNSMSSIIET